MNTFTIAALVGLGIFLFGILIAGLMVWFSRLVTVNQAEIEQEQSAYNPAVTLGHMVPVNADKDEQLRAARKEAARRAAATPRWANMRIGRKGAANTKPASKGLAEDPLTAVHIAAYHTWNGAKTGIPAGGVPEAAPVTAAAPVAVPTKKPEDLVPGKDYPFIEVTDDMSPAEVRQARIANAKAKSAAVKALKTSAEAAPAAAAPAAAPAQPAAPAVSVPEPDLIEITDDMPADEVRKARIANAKAQSAYKKALKQAEAAAPAPAAAPAAAAPAAAPAQPVAPAVSVPEPDLIEITDDMPADEVRQARIANAKAQSAYKKALREAQAAAPAPAQPAAVQAAPAAQPAPAQQPAGDGGQDAALAAIPKPDIIEITDGMEPAEVRSARISNAKAMAAYKKALKQAGIDPNTVEI
jgi:hypothetical protein